jgi:hypothetical protein
LEKWSGEVNAFANSAVGLGCAAGICEKRSVGDEGNLLPAYYDDDHEHGYS